MNGSCLKSRKWRDRRGLLALRSCLGLRSRRKRKAWGVSPRTFAYHDLEPAIAGDSLHLANLPPAYAGLGEISTPWGSRPRLYAHARFAG